MDLSTNDGNESKEAKLKQLWEKFRSNIGGWGAQQMWDAFNDVLIPELMDEISALCANDSTTSRFDSNID